MPHRQIFHDAFDPDDLQIAIRAFDRALLFLTESGDADDDPKVKVNLAQQIISIMQGSQRLTFLEVTNRAIAAYRHHRAMMMVRTIQLERAK